MDKEKDILKWFNGELSDEEIKNLQASEGFDTFEKIRFYSEQFDVPKRDVAASLEDFKQNYRSKATKEKTPETKIRKLNLSMFYKVAAAVVLLATLSYFMFSNNMYTLETSVAQNKQISLPDGSEVTLNAGSKLAYNKNSWKNERNLELEGEAFFKVAKGEKFTVQMDEESVQVLGTQFNIKDRENYFDVQCFEGKVRVTFTNGETILTKGKAFRMLKGKKGYVYDIVDEKPSWMQQESSFNEVPLSEVIEELERQYDIKIKTENVNVSQLYTGTFTHTNKELALQSVAIPLRMEYKINENEVIFYHNGDK
ncbi:FecR domain-containing protein [Kordia algicida OT-1]|uniref:Possible anti-sigma factor n=1 Tax=Kordia algicida OT-1 TaxID=391587 RepID=A9DTH3_9FLAO|nr:FecR domain-containing protein [Kordia algicida]EDP97074.1 possible anti-sigma factor [Kordia algicida OT-1]